MSARRTKRADGRYSVTARLERPDGTIRRTYFYGRTQAEAKAEGGCGSRAHQPAASRFGM